MTTRTRPDPVLVAPAPPTKRPSPAAQSLAFVFTDIESSTRLLEALRDRYAEVLASHGRLIRDAATGAGGEVVDTQGDSFFLVFATADQAVAFATAAQHALARQRWPKDTDLRVRMGIHAGEATPNAGGYVGLDVHRAARIMSAAHGGQVLLSPEAASALANGAARKDIGQHQLKDFKAPIELHQLLIDGLPTDFPPPRVMDEPDQPPAPGDPPYQGLAHFEDEDAERFFGREKLVERLVARLGEQPFLAVIGASGSGKSSVIRAGLIPALRAKGVKRVVLLTPTAEPLAALTDALGSEQLGPGSLLVVDQAEELFSLCRDEAQRSEFIERLLAATEAGGYVVLTLRADFYDRLAGYPALRDLVAARQEYLGQMSAEELRVAIAGPARAGDWRFDAGLVDLILHDVGSEPGALPLLSHALLETWQRRRGRLMMLRGYLESGGVQAAIARSADRLMAELAPDQQLIARTIFLRLTEFGAGTPDTRRRAGRTELVGQADGEAASAVLQRLAEHRLVVLGEDTAEVAHEALIREWPTLREWLAADREALRLHRGLTEAAGEWQRANREPSLLFRGARLAAALDWAPAHAAELNALERDFLDESRLASEREAQRQRTINRRLRFLLAGAGVFLVVAIGAGAYAALEAGRAEQEATRALGAQMDADGARLEAERQAEEAQRERDAAQQERDRAEREEERAAEEARRAEEEARRAEEQARLASAREIAASAIAVLEDDPELSILLALEAVELGGEAAPEAVTALHRAVQASRSIFHVELDEPPLIPMSVGVALSPDGETLYVATDSRSVRVFDVASRELVRTLGQPGEDSERGFLSVVVSPDGKRVALVDEEAMIHVWSTDDWSEKTMQAQGSGSDWPAFSPDGTMLATITEDTEAEEAIISVWDVNTATELRSWRSSGTWAVSFHPNGRQVLSTECVCYSERAVVLLDIESGEEKLAVENVDGIRGSRPVAAHFSPDGTVLATASDDGKVHLWDALTGDKTLTFPGHADRANFIVFSPDGARLATTSEDGTTRVWDIEAGHEAMALRGQGGAPLLAAFSGDGNRLATGSSNLTARVWDLSPTRVAEIEGYQVGRRHVYDLDARGDTLAVLTYQCHNCHGQVDVFSRATGQHMTLPVVGTGVGLYPDGAALIAQAAVDGEEGRPSFESALPEEGLIARGPAQKYSLWSGEVEFQLEGSCPYAGGEWDDPPENCGLPPAMPWTDNIRSARFSDDGSLLVMTGWVFSPEAGFRGSLTTWDAGGKLMLGPISMEAGVKGVAISPDRKLLAVSSRENHAVILDAATLEELQRLDLTNPGVRMEFSPDGANLAVTSDAGRTRVYDVGTWTYSELPTQSRSVDFSADGERLLTFDLDGTLRLWDVASGRELHAVPVGTGQGATDQGAGARFLDDERYAVTYTGGALVVMTLDTQELQRVARERVTRSLTVAECEKYHIDACDEGELELAAP